jgi:hypothetical protein
MVLPHVLRAVTVLAQNFGHHGSALGNLAGIPGIGIRQFRDNSHTYRMVIASRQECRARRRA